MKKITPIVIASGNGAPGLAAGIAVLRKGGSALDAVEACARVIEADPSDTSVGRGGKPNVLGVVELDASLVDGTTHRVGAVGALTGYLHPITVARAVMERLPHVMLVGDGAARFAAEIGAQKATLLTPSTRRMWVERLAKARETPASLRRRPKLAPVVIARAASRPPCRPVGGPTSTRDGSAIRRSSARATSAIRATAARAAPDSASSRSAT